MKNFQLFFLLLCTIAFGSDSTRQSIRDHYHFSTKGSIQLDAKIDFGIGDLILSPNKTRNDIDGVIQYDPIYTAPKVNLLEHGNSAALTIDVSSNDSSYHFDIDRIKDLKDFDSKNVMDFSLPTAIPTVLDLDFGFGTAEIDLSGLRIEKLNVECGFSDVNIISNKFNPIECRNLKLESGLGDLSIMGLGNIHARSIDLNVGLGSANVDFRGDQLIDTDFDIEVGLGDLDLILPERANIKLYVNDTFLSSVAVYGLIEESENEWVSENWRPGLPVINLDISVGLGSADISVKY